MEKASIERSLRSGKRPLGERMYAAGIDNGELGAKISALDEQLLRAEAVGGSTQLLGAARHQLVLHLAAAALVDDGPLPGAESDYRRTREAQEALAHGHLGVTTRIATQEKEGATAIETGHSLQETFFVES